MCNLVSLHVSLLIECLITHITGIWTLASMFTLM